MSTVYLSRKDETVRAILGATFPSYNGQRIHARVQTSVSFHGTQWDEGNRRNYRVLNLSTMRSESVQEAPFLQRSPLHEGTFDLVPGVCVVAYVQGRYEHIEIIAHPDNVQKLLPAPVKFTPFERRCLIATRSFKSSYGGVKNYRQVESGLTPAEWETTKAGLIVRGFLNKAGAITTEGRNAIGNADLFYEPPIVRPSALEA